MTNINEIEHHHIEQTLNFVSQRGWVNSEEIFIFALARYLTRLLDVNYVCVGKLLADQKTVSTTTVSAEGKIVNMSECVLKGTACEKVIGHSTCIYPQNIQSLFPRDQLLVGLGIESFGGIPLWDSAGNALGMLAVMHSTKFENIELIRSQLQLLSMRVASELEHNEFENRLRQHKDSLAKIQHIAQVGNWELDRVNWKQHFWSEETYRIVGRTLPFPPTSMEEFSQYFTPESWNCLAAAIEQGLIKGTPFRCDVEVISIDGNNRWASICGEARHNVAGAVVGLSGTIQDITKRKQMEARLQDSEAHLNAIIEFMPVGLFVKDANNRFLMMNKVCEDQFGLNFDKLHGADASQFFPAEQLAHILATDAAVFASGEMIDIEETFWNVQLKQHRLVRSIKKPVYDETGAPLYLICLSIDITENKQFVDSLRLANLVLKHCSEGILVTDENNLIVAVNPAFTTITEYTFEEVRGKNPKIFCSGFHDPAFYQAMWQTLNDTGHWEGEIWDKRKNGELHAEWLSINTVRNKDDGVSCHIALFSDITERKQSEDLVWRQANFDTLTGLPNRRMFRDRLEQEIMKSQRANLPLALLLVDLDEFKEVNDTLGHDMGDILLKEAALRIAQCVRASDTVARLGGDEFTVVLSELADTSHIEDIALKIINRLSEPFHLHSKQVFISASIGITLYPDDAANLESLMKNADQAMYLSKQLGRNRFSYFTPALQEAAQKRLQLTYELRVALTANQFEVYYQSIVELASGNIHKAEALIRWHHPMRGMVSPADFIPLAEESGLIIDIGEWVFQQAAHQAHDWRKRFHPDFQVSVNRSPAQFRNPTRENHLPCLNYLKELQFSGQGIVFEITEGLLMDTHSMITETLLKFRNAGIQVALDDFGTGYSSLSYLKKFDIDYLKIDKSFIDHIATDESSVALCEAIIVMAHKLGLKVIAEGVETEPQRQILADAGCDYGQGYLFSRPLPLQEFEKLLA